MTCTGVQTDSKMTVGVHSTELKQSQLLQAQEGLALLHASVADAAVTSMYHMAVCALVNCTPESTPDCIMLGAFSNSVTTMW